MTLSCHFEYCIAGTHRKHLHCYRRLLPGPHHILLYLNSNRLDSGGGFEGGWIAVDLTPLVAVGEKEEDSTC